MQILLFNKTCEDARQSFHTPPTPPLLFHLLWKLSMQRPTTASQEEHNSVGVYTGSMPQHVPLHIGAPPSPHLLPSPTTRLKDDKHLKLFHSILCR